jgi:N-acetylmuramic acid 6-phosphate etherase
MGVLDGVELLPTFGWPSERVAFVIAGGMKALTRSVEGAEDQFHDGFSEALKLNSNSSDVLISLSASGNSEFTLGTVSAAKQQQTFSIGISNNLKSSLKETCDLHIPILTGGELIAGSTRLNAGTSQKICLNIISSLVMSKLGRVKKGLMIDMIASNKKLKERQKKIEISLTSKVK